MIHRLKGEFAKKQNKNDLIVGNEAMQKAQKTT